MALPIDGEAAVYVAAENFVPERLTIAREAAGLTQTDLAERVDTTQPAISQFESADSRPSPRTVARLSLALAVPPGFFAGPVKARIDQSKCHFRALRRVRKSDQVRVLARGDLVLLVADHVETLLHLPDVAIPSILVVPGDRSTVETAAQRLRDEWELGWGPIPKVIRLLESKGIFVVEGLATTSDIDAFSVWRCARPIIVLGADKGATRRRFDASHELGHIVMHPDAKPGDKKRERQADRFASAFLLPEEPFRRECPHRFSWHHLRALKKRWGVSLSALVRRARDLGIYSDYAYRRANQQLRAQGWHPEEPEEPEVEHPSLLTRALEVLSDQGHVASGFASELGLPEERILDLVEGSRPDPTLRLGL